MVQEIERILDGLDDKDRKIILCARSEFAKYGFYNANMDRIALSAGLGKGTLYRRFISKQILFFVTIQADQRELVKRLEQLDTDLPLRQQIETHLAAAVEYIV
ncbi:MAG TPA: helix-turn-helix domain-containing protein, partial [Spirochaetota bacterium]|nr:helix-turn-helix domain-containing protein [Spirochaetota bacterium]